MKKKTYNFDIWCGLRVFMMLALMTSVAYAACYITKVTGTGVSDNQNGACEAAIDGAKRECDALGGTLGKEVGPRSMPRDGTDDDPWAELYKNSMFDEFFVCERVFECTVCSSKSKKTPAPSATETPVSDPI